ncbi:hypothetical protein [Treponema sp. R80B11-R83G3]
MSNRYNRTPKKQRRHPLFLALLIANYSLFIVSCDLFTGPKVDLFKQISDEVDWANAAKLTVTVAFPPEWGNSPQSGEGKCGDTRLGYEFGVEFTPLSGFGFEKWLAFKTADYAELDKNVSSGEVESLSLNDKGVIITESTSDTGARTAKVKINIKEPVTLVPWCDPRPRLTQQTNPPLNPILTPFPFNQTVNVWFNMGIKTETAVLGETVTVTGIYASNVGNNVRGQPFNGDGDLSGYFMVGFPAANRIVLTPKEETASELALLSISVTLWPGVQNLNGVAMAQAEVISYQTDSREAQKAYRAEYITASRNGTSWFGDTADYPWNSPSIDRRFNQSDRKTAHIKFSVNPPEGAPSVPNKIKVVERLAYNLGGFNASGQTVEDECTDFTLSGGVYTFTHVLQTDRSGIIQIIILPLHDDADAPVQPLLANEAVAEGQYVTVVMDLSAPDVNNLSARLNEPSSFETINKTIHVYGAGKGITLTVDGLEDLADNGTQGGIRAAQAWGLPWTMDEASSLYWYVRIGEDTQAEKKTSGRLNVYNGLTLNKTWSPESITDLQDTGGYRVYVKFEDSIGNVSTDWKDTLLIVKYSTEIITPVTGLQAVCNAAGNSITVSWTTPEGMTGAYVSVNGIEERIDDKDTKDFQVPVINKSGVRGGQAVGGVTRYDISVVAYNAAGKAAAQTLSVWNIEGMTVTQGNTVLLTQSNFSTALVANSVNNFVLTEDVTLSEWTPLAGNFTGKFYGNGHTISISGLTVAENMGLFGTVSGENAVVRDLSVRYSGSATGPAAESRFGCIAGTATLGARLENILVKGDFTFNVTGSNKAYIGGIAGIITGETRTTIKNAYSSLNLTVSKNNGSILKDTNNNVLSLNVGGVTGSCGNNDYVNIGSNWENIGNDCIVTVEETSVVGDITVGSSSHLVISHTFVGGFSGFINGLDNNGLKSVELSNSDYKQGSITVWIDQGYVCSGGFGGEITNCDIKNCGVSFNRFEMNKTPIDIDNENNTSMGGFCGQIMTSTIVNCYSEGQIVSNIGSNSTEYLTAGGFVGTLSGNISYCYSKADLSSVAYGYVELGGFLGNIDGAELSYCYATGNVNAVRIGDNPGSITAGALFALAVVPCTINDCYALGDIFINGRGNAGGVCGELRNSDMNHCFAKGSVIAQRQLGSQQSYTGGLVGRIYTTTPTDSTIPNSATIQNSAALGLSVTATGPGTKNIGRVLGAGTGTNNYAYNAMKLYEHETYQYPWPREITAPGYSGTVTLSKTSDGKDGEDAGLGDFRNRDFWRTTLGFSDSAWDFSTVESRGYPILRGPDGRVLGGQ